MPQQPPQRDGEPSVVLRLDQVEARAAWHALGAAVQLMDAVDPIPPHAPLYGQRDRLIAVAQRLDHEINHAPGGRCHG